MFAAAGRSLKTQLVQPAANNRPTDTNCSTLNTRSLLTKC